MTQNLQVGDLVYVRKNFTRKGESKKLSVLFHNLSQIIEEQNPFYLIQNLSNNKHSWVHHNQLRKKITLDSDDMLRIRHNSHSGHISERVRVMSECDDLYDDDDDTSENIISIPVGHNIPAVNAAAEAIGATPAEARGDIPDVRRMATIDRNAIAVEPVGSATIQEHPRLARQIGEDGILRSSRRPMHTRNSDFVYN